MATNVVTTLALGPDPINMICPRCQANIQTATETETSSTGWGLGICLAIFGYLCLILLVTCPILYKITEEPKKTENSRFCET